MWARRSCDEVNAVKSSKASVDGSGTFLAAAGISYNTCFLRVICVARRFHHRYTLAQRSDLLEWPSRSRDSVHSNHLEHYRSSGCRPNYRHSRLQYIARVRTSVLTIENGEQGCITLFFFLPLSTTSCFFLNLTFSTHSSPLPPTPPLLARHHSSSSSKASPSPIPPSAHPSRSKTQPSHNPGTSAQSSPAQARTTRPSRPTTSCRTWPRPPAHHPRPHDGTARRPWCRPSASPSQRHHHAS